ncbi:3-hydroxyacyl-CoA dehydrogenase NAD-binding domain-containing protein [Novosphingobium sp. SG720]|uniref:3-hydroxyacyl-CoA dehydrogenase NAD-binding domain-containing protein n=1 Tax=Novosphingobium sp. SG720 TaxID=2586998 RepID=UPI001445D3F9|nr:3-hydroxybutyryl-CoA dehydrogenase [Novosphingobium sp. SG720]
MNEIIRIGVCGAGTMGSGIAQVAAQAGHPVVIYDVHAPSRDRSREQITKGLATLVARGKLEPGEPEAMLSTMAWTDDPAGLADCDLVIEAIVEDLAIKQGLFAALEANMRSDAVIASNTSSLSIARLARGLAHPGRFMGMHFFNPATAMKLVELVSGPATDPAVAARVADVAKRWGKVGVPVTDVPGFIVNRVARPFYGEAFTCLQQHGAPANVIDHLFKHAAGFRMGPLELTDLIGQDVNFAVARSVFDAYFGQTRFVPQLAQSALVDANWLGRKTGRGIYDYAQGKGFEQPVAPGAAMAADAARRPAELHWCLPAFDLGKIHVRASRGRTARDEALEIGRPVAVLDWFDESCAGSIGYAASDDEAGAAVEAKLAEWGLAAHRLADRPGLVVLRTLAQIANAAGDAVLEHVSDEQGIDAALRFGANYPFGPCAWARRFGVAALVDTLAAIAAATGHAMYKPSEYWVNLA